MLKIIILPITTIIVRSDGPIKLLLGLPVPQNRSSSLLAILLSFSSPHTQPSFLHLAEFLIPFTPLEEKGKQLSQGEKKNFLPFHLQAEESIKYEDKSAPSSGQVWMFTSRYYLLY